MAKLKVYSVFDSKVQAYAKPFFMRTRGEALRAWQEVANDPKTDIGRFPHDFALMELGEFDEDSGSFLNTVPPLNLGLAVEVSRSGVQSDLEDRIAASNITAVQSSLTQ